MSGSLCENCRKGQLEMCQYFKEHFLEEGNRVVRCPAFEPQEDTVVLSGKYYGAAAAALHFAKDKRVFIDTDDPVGFIRMLLQEMNRLQREDTMWSMVARLKDGGEIVIGGF